MAASKFQEYALTVGAETDLSGVPAERDITIGDCLTVTTRRRGKPGRLVVRFQRGNWCVAPWTDDIGQNHVGVVRAILRSI